MELRRPEIRFYPSTASIVQAEMIGFRFGAKGTHTSRTMMLEEVKALFDVTQEDDGQDDYTAAIIDGNCLSKATTATRRLSSQRLRELYGLDPKLSLLRVFRRLWKFDRENRPRLALLAAIARDPLLAASASSIIPLAKGENLHRELMKANLRSIVGDRLNNSTLEKVCRNAASSWTQSGHLEGRRLKKRRTVQASPTTTAFALYLASAVGYRGAGIFKTAWFRVLDCDPSQARHYTFEAKRLGLVNIRMVGDVVELDVSVLDPESKRT